MSEGSIDNVENDVNLCFYCGGSGMKRKKEKSGPNEKRKSVMRQCNGCHGVGIIHRTGRKRADGSWRKKKFRKSFPNFVAPGPFPVGDVTKAYLLEQDDEELCFLTGNWKIFQKLNKHRYSTDDLVTTWLACNAAESLGYTDNSRGRYVANSSSSSNLGGCITSSAVKILDMGCGIGSVLLANAWQFPHAICLGVEAQLDRYSQALRSVEYNLGDGCSRVKVVNGDLRDMSTSTLLAAISPTGAGKSCRVNDPVLTDTSETLMGFDIITGTPPYFPPGSGSKSKTAQPACVQSAACLFEVRGGVEEYCAAAAKHLRKPPLTATSMFNDGSITHSCSLSSVSSTELLPSLFVMVNTALGSSRVYDACRREGLSVIKRLDVIPVAPAPSSGSAVSQESVAGSKNVGPTAVVDENSSVAVDVGASDPSQHPLFCVFVIVLDGWLDANNTKVAAYASLPQLHPHASGDDIGGIESSNGSLSWQSPGQGSRVVGSVRGEIVDTLHVRESKYNVSSPGGHTTDYQALLRDLGMPSSADKTLYSVNNEVT